MEVEWSPVREPAAQRVWRLVLRPIAGQLRACADELAERAVARMRAEMPSLFADTQAIEEHRVSTRAHLTQLADTLELADDPQRFELPGSTLGIMRSGVRRRIALPDLMRFYRLAYEQVWQWMFTRVVAETENAEEQAAALELATRWLFAYTDGAMVRGEHAYELERESWMRSAAEARAAAIEDILAGREGDVARASTRLRYEVNRHHLGVIVWLERVPDHDAQPELGDALAELARVFEAESVLSHHLGSLALAGWISRRNPFGANDIDTVVAAGAATIPPGVRIAFGEPWHGLSGFRQSHVQAIHARRVASLLGSRAEDRLRYRDIAVAALCTTDLDHAHAFARNVLGPLADDDETTYRLAMTLSVYLEENRSRRRAAERLTVHPNTISYRVHQAEEILGRSVDTDTLDLRLALAILPTLPGLPSGTAPW